MNPYGSTAIFTANARGQTSGINLKYVRSLDPFKSHFLTARAHDVLPRRRCPHTLLHRQYLNNEESTAVIYETIR